MALRALLAGCVLALLAGGAAAQESAVYSRTLEAELMEQAGAAIGRKDYAAAERAYFELLKKKEAARGKDHYDLVEQWRALARLYRLQGRYDDAEYLIGRTLKLWPVTVLGVKFDGTPTELQNLAALRVDKRQYEEAFALYLNALERLENDLEEAKTRLGPGHGTYARLVGCLERMVRLTTKMGRTQQAQDFERRLAAHRVELEQRPPLLSGRPESWGQAVFDINP